MNLAVATSPDGVSARTARGGALNVPGLEPRSAGRCFARSRVHPAGPRWGLAPAAPPSPGPRWEGRIPGAASEITVVYLRSQPSSLINYRALALVYSFCEGEKGIIYGPPNWV